MFKKIALLLLSLFIAPSFLGAFNHESGNTIVAKAEEEEGDVLHGYTYTETVSPNGTTIRTYDSHALTPEIVQNFSAPMGFIFTLSVTEMQLDEIFAQAEHLGYEYDSVSTKYFYKTFGMDIEVDTFNAFYDQEDQSLKAKKEFMISKLSGNINNLMLLKMDEVSIETDLTFFFQFSFYAEGNGYYEFVFYGDLLNIKPYGINDFISYQVLYDENANNNVRKIVISADPIPGFFYCSPLYNIHGFHTDINNPTYDSTLGPDAFFSQYEMTLIAYDSVPIGSTNGYLELTCPSERTPARIKLEFTSNGQEYEYFSNQFYLGDPNISITVDGNPNRTSIHKNHSHDFGVSLEDEDYDIYNTDYFKFHLEAVPFRLKDESLGVILYDQKLPEKGEIGKYYYIPSDDEVAAHNQGKDSEYSDVLAEGKYYVWNESESIFDDYSGLQIIDSFYYFELEEGGFDYDKYAVASAALPFAGTWFFRFVFGCFNKTFTYSYKSDIRTIEVVDSGETEDVITLNVSDNINLVAGAGEIEIFPEIEKYGKTIEFYYDYEISKSGVIEYEIMNDSIVINPINAGLITLTISMESALFSKISKTISIRVLDAIYDVATIEESAGFHLSGKPVTLSLNIRGFTNFLNLKVDWTITDKKGKVLPDTIYRDNGDATITLVHPETGDYTIAASYEGIQLSKLTIEVRYIDMDNFLKMHIWWIILITIASVLLLVFVKYLTSRGKTTVQHIERVYNVFYQFMSDDKLTKFELIRIKHELIKCLHSVEDLNIDALNLYEKSIRYLNRSLQDAKMLIKHFEDFSASEKAEWTEHLNRHLSRALNVSKEIEAAKDILKEHQIQANVKNFEIVGDIKKKNKKDNKK